MDFTACYITNIGNDRECNEDSLMLHDLIINDVNMVTVECLTGTGDYRLFIVADGMGGHSKGELASRTVLEVFRQNVDKYRSIDDIVDTLGKARRVLNDMVDKDHSILGFGTTVAGLLFAGEQMIVFNSGDSRVYRLSGRYLERITKDHSVVQNLVDAGLITEEEMRTHPQKHVITAAIIGDKKVDKPAVYSKAYMNDNSQRYLLCTDGIWESLSIEEMEQCFIAGSVQNIAQALFVKAMQNKAKDNVSLIVIERCSHE